MSYVRPTGPAAWCWICRWVQFTGHGAPIPWLRICECCWSRPIEGWKSRRKRGDDPSLDAEDDGGPLGLRVHVHIGLDHVADYEIPWHDNMASSATRDAYIRAWLLTLPAKRLDDEVIVPSMFTHWTTDEELPQ